MIDFIDNMICQYRSSITSGCHIDTYIATIMIDITYYLLVSMYREQGERLGGATETFIQVR